MQDKEISVVEIILARLDKIEQKIDEIVVSTARQDVTLGNQHRSLEEHIRRTAALEKIVQRLVKHMTWAEGTIKALGLLSLIAGVATSLIKLVW